jgi:hypothetical protein
MWLAVIGVVRAGGSFADDFEDGDYSAWTVRNGDWTEADGALSGTAGTAGGPTIYADSGMARNIDSFEMTATAAGNVAFGFFLAWDGTKTGYCGFYWNEQSEIRWAHDGEDASLVSVSWINNTSYEVGFSVSPGQVAITMDGEEVWTGDGGCDAYLGTGEVGLAFPVTGQMSLYDLSIAWEYAPGDDDGDGYTEDEGDCDNADATISPEAEETWYDGVDSDCAGDDDYDYDGDGSPVDEDCDDTDWNAFPGNTEVWYDAVDGDCDGANDFDQDGDGVEVADDCSDADATIYPGAPEVGGDGIDQDCDGVDAPAPEDTGTPGEKGETAEGGGGGKGCGCASGGGIPGAGLAVGLALALRRRR